MGCGSWNRNVIACVCLGVISSIETAECATKCSAKSEFRESKQKPKKEPSAKGAVDTRKEQSLQLIMLDGKPALRARSSVGSMDDARAP